MGSVIYRTLEDATIMATDIVVAQYVTRRPFGERLTEFEFVVHERIFGNAADRIFVYVSDRERSIMNNDRPFTSNTQYLLILEKLTDVYANTHEDGFTFITDLMLDLNSPTSSTMYNEPLTLHSTGMNFDSRSLTRDDIVSYISTLTQNNAPAREYIRSDDLKDIVEGSPHILIVEITEPRRLVHEQNSTDWMSTDIYHTTIIEVLKGDKQVGDTVQVIFFADTVFPGETHIVSMAPRDPAAPYFYSFTSRHSLHPLSQRDEIIALISGTTPPSSR